MCLTLHIHETACNTQPTVHYVGTHADETIDMYHFLATPGPCSHTRQASRGACPQHGSCCRLQTRRVCDKFTGVHLLSCLGNLEAHLTIPKGTRQKWLDLLAKTTIPTDDILIRRLMKPADQERTHEALRAYFDCGAEVHCLLASMGAAYPNHHVARPESGTRWAVEAWNEDLLRRIDDAYMAWRTASLALLNPKNSEMMSPAILHRNTARPSWYGIFRFPGPGDDGSRSRWDQAPPTPEESVEESAGEGTWVSILSHSGSGDATPPGRTYSPERMDHTAEEEEEPLPDARDCTSMEQGNVAYDPMDVDASPFGQEEEQDEEMSQARSSSVCSSEATLSPVPREWMLRRLSNDLRRMGSEVVAPRRRRC